MFAGGRKTRPLQLIDNIYSKSIDIFGILSYYSLYMCAVLCAKRKEREDRVERQAQALRV